MPAPGTLPFPVETPQGPRAPLLKESRRDSQGRLSVCLRSVWAPVVESPQGRTEVIRCVAELFISGGEIRQHGKSEFYALML